MSEKMNRRGFLGTMVTTVAAAELVVSGRVVAVAPDGPSGWTY